MCLAIPGKIVAITGAGLDKKACVDFGSLQKEVSLVYTPEVKIGEFVLIHVGFALKVLKPEKALQILNDLDEVKE